MGGTIQQRIYINKSIFWVESTAGLDTCTEIRVQLLQRWHLYHTHIRKHTSRSAIESSRFSISHTNEVSTHSNVYCFCDSFIHSYSGIFAQITRSSYTQKTRNQYNPSHTQTSYARFASILSSAILSISYFVIFSRTTHSLILMHAHSILFRTTQQRPHNTHHY